MIWMVVEVDVILHHLELNPNFASIQRLKLYMDESIHY